MRYLKYIILLILLSAVLLARFFGAGELLSLENLESNQEKLDAFIADHYLISVLVFILVYFMVIGLSIPSAALLTFASGLLFGALPGTIYTNIGATAGAATIFLITRYVFGESIQNKYRDKLRKFNEDFRKNGVQYLLTLRLIPVFPFFVVNILAGLTNIKLRNFIWTTSLGILPGSFVFALAGSQIGNISSLDQVLSPGVIISLLLLAALPLLQIAYKRYRGAKSV